jgi:hypothetical protein
MFIKRVRLTKELWLSSALSMWQMIPIPAAQRRVTGILKEIFQRRRFKVAIAEYYVGLPLMT